MTSDGDSIRPCSAQQIPEDAVPVFSGILFDVYQWRQELFDGSYATHEMLRRPDTVLVLALTESGTILLAEQDRPGGTTFIGAFGGRVEDGETPEQAARRELLEESGLESPELILWDAVQPFAKIDWAVYIFVAKRVRHAKAPQLESGERMRIKEISFDELKQLALDPKFGDREISWKIAQCQLDPRAARQAEAVFAT